jgi:hypothetical protein
MVRPSALSKAELAEDGHRRTPLCKRGLQKVEADKGGEKVPIGADPVAEGERQQNDDSSHCTKCFIYGHFEHSPFQIPAATAPPRAAVESVGTAVVGVALWRQEFEITVVSFSET